MRQGKISLEENQRANQAMVVWGVFIIAAILINGTILFASGKDMHAWTASATKDVLFNIVTIAAYIWLSP